MAEALSYLHKNSVVHRDIKPSNVLLDGEFIAKVGDYGLVREVDPDRTCQSMSIRGYIKYMDPEYELTGKAGPASDVYSFGLVLLEMVSGKKPTPSSSNTNQTAEFASSQLAEKIRAALRSNKLMAIFTEVVDPRLKGVPMDQIIQMQRVLRLGLQCVQFDHRLRPTSEQVHRYLTGEDPLPPVDEHWNLPNTSVDILHGTRGMHQFNFHSLKPLMIINLSRKLIIIY
jgi:serine/threonine protein kinase